MFFDILGVALLSQIICVCNYIHCVGPDIIELSKAVVFTMHPEFGSSDFGPDRMFYNTFFGSAVIGTSKTVVFKLHP